MRLATRHEVVVVVTLDTAAATSLPVETGAVKERARPPRRLCTCTFLHKPRDAPLWEPRVFIPQGAVSTLFLSLFMCHVCLFSIFWDRQRTQNPSQSFILYETWEFGTVVYIEYSMFTLSLVMFI